MRMHIAASLLVILYSLTSGIYAKTTLTYSLSTLTSSEVCTTKYGKTTVQTLGTTTKKTTKNVKTTIVSTYTPSSFAPTATSLVTSTSTSTSIDSTILPNPTSTVIQTTTLSNTVTHFAGTTFTVSGSIVTSTSTIPTSSGFTWPTVRPTTTQKKRYVPQSLEPREANADFAGVPRAASSLFPTTVTCNQHTTIYKVYAKSVTATFTTIITPTTTSTITQTTGLTYTSTIDQSSTATVTSFTTTSTVVNVTSTQTQTSTVTPTASAAVVYYASCEIRNQIAKDVNGDFLQGGTLNGTPGAANNDQLVTLSSIIDAYTCCARCFAYSDGSNNNCRATQYVSGSKVCYLVVGNTCLPQEAAFRPGPKYGNSPGTDYGVIFSASNCGGINLEADR